nr:hypothetical protein [Providencia stuartii]
MQKTTKKKTNRYFNGVPTTRLIVTCEQSIIDQVDSHIRADRVTRGNRAEFVRQAIIEKLQREFWWFIDQYDIVNALMIYVTVRAREWWWKNLTLTI